MKHLALIPLLFVASCAAQRSSRLAVRPIPPPAVERPDAVRHAEVVRPYHFGRYVDPNHPFLMHEQHPVYRVEASARWNLQSGSSVSPLNPPPDAAFAPPPTNDVVLAELSRQRDATERVMREAAQMSRAYDELQKIIAAMTEVAKNHAWMRARLAALEERLAEVDARRITEPSGAVSPSGPDTSVPPAP